MKSRLIIIIMFLGLLFSACGNKEEAAIDNYTTISYSDNLSVDVAIVKKGKALDLTDEELRQFVKLVEETVNNDCISGLQLQCMVSTSTMRECANNGYYISVKYNPAKELYVGKSDKTKVIEEVYILISYKESEEVREALIMYNDENASRVFDLWKTSYDLILEYLE